MSTTESNAYTEISLNSVSNMFYLAEQDLFSNRYIENLKKSLDPLINASVGRFGIDITDMECRVLEVILQGFTETGYSGNYKSISKQELKNRMSGNEIDLESSYLDVFPRLKFTQGELLDRLGIGRNQIGAISRAIAALESLAEKMFTFYYERKVLDKEGRAEFDQDGSCKYESVVAQGSLLTLLRILDSTENKLKNYEVVLNPIFLEERENHCVLIPSNWREEVSLTLGKKKTSSTIFKFMIFLRYVYEMYNRNKTKPPYRLEYTQEEMAQVLRIPKSVIKNRKRVCALLEECYSTAKQLGYLEDYKLGKFLHTIILNEDKYFSASPQIASQ